MSTQLITTTRLCCIWHHIAEVFGLYNCCSNMVQMSICGTGRVRPHCTEHWPTISVTLKPYNSYWSIVQSLTNSIMNVNEHSTPLHLTSRSGSVRATRLLL